MAVGPPLWSNASGPGVGTTERGDGLHSPSLNDRIRDGIGVAAVAALPPVYVWALPCLADPHIRFASRCPGFPACSKNFLRAVTVGDFLATPQATGAYMAVFFWSGLHMWQLKSIISRVIGRHGGLLVVLVFYFGFGMSLMVPTTLSKGGHIASNFAYCCSGLIIFAILLRQFGGRRTGRAQALMVVATACVFCTMLIFGLAFLLHLLDYDTLNDSPAVTWMVFVLQAGSLSCLSILPWCWRAGDPEMAVEHEGRMTPTASFDTWNIVQHSTPLRGVVCLLATAPVAYIWVLPWLASIGFCRTCPGAPRCTDSSIGASVSNFIATPQATGAMGTAFFWPLAHMWSHKGDIQGSKMNALLMVFITFFGLFLACPVTVYPTAHSMVVGLFSVCGLLYFKGLLPYCRHGELSYCRVLLMLSITAFLGVILLVLSNAVGCLTLHCGLVRDDLPWVFYACEAVGLSCMSLFPWFWKVDGAAIASGSLALL